MSFLVRAQSSVCLTLRRNLGFTAILGQKAVASDPIQKLFIQAIKEYDQKSKAAGGKLVEPTPETERELQTELDRVAKIFGGGAGVDMTKFPTFKFEGNDPVIDPINQQAKE